MGSTSVKSKEWRVTCLHKCCLAHPCANKGIGKEKGEEFRCWLSLKEKCFVGWKEERGSGVPWIPNDYNFEHNLFRHSVLFVLCGCMWGLPSSLITLLQLCSRSVTAWMNGLSVWPGRKAKKRINEKNKLFTNYLFIVFFSVCFRPTRNDEISALGSGWRLIQCLFGFLLQSTYTLGS